MNQILKIGNITADLVTRNMYFLQIAKTYSSFQQISTFYDLALKFTVVNTTSGAIYITAWRRSCWRGGGGGWRGG